MARLPSPSSAAAARDVGWGGAAACVLGAVSSLACSATGAPHVEGAAELPRSTSARSAEVVGAPLPVASYALEVTLDEPAGALQGSGTITWTNRSYVATPEVYFHLYLNAFKSERTLFNRSPLTRARSGRLPRRWGRIDLEQLSARELGGTSLLERLEPHSPGDPEDETDRRLELPRAVAPGETLTFDVRFRAELPEIVERTGLSRDFVFAGQWFPKLARLERSGRWAHFAFHPHAEFYADFGTYDVRLDVPEAMVVGATGHRVSEALAGGRRVAVYSADAVHDFAWTAWRGFEEQQARIGDVAVRLLYPHGHDENARHALDAVRFGLPHFEARYGAYPYADLTVVHPPWFAAAAGGMEYPTLITTGGAWHLSHWSRAIENVTIHELGHQWFYGLLASHEARWPFLDEGLNSYAESVATEAMLGAASGADLFGLTISADALRRASLVLAPQSLPIGLEASAFPSFNEIGGIVYSKTALLFRTLANVYGHERLEAALRSYALRFRFAHPTPEDLLTVLGDALGPEALANLRKAIFEGHGVNYELRDLRAVRLRAAPGAPADAPPRFESRISVYRHGELQLPVELELETAAGERIERRWDGAGRFTVLSHVGASPIVSAIVDPRSLLAIEGRREDNALRAHRDSPAHTAERTVFAIQWLLALLSP